MSFSHAKKPAPSDVLRQRDELERFKTGINLTEYAASEGYQLDRRASSRNSGVMRHPGGDKIVIARGEDGHWIYFSVRDGTDNDEDGAGFAASSRVWSRRRGAVIWRPSGPRPPTPRTGTMCFCVRAGWFLQSVDRIPWYVPYFSLFLLFLPGPR